MKSKIDITEFSQIKTGDEVVIFGVQKDKIIKTLDVAKASGISKVNCESLCFLGKRVARIFIENGKVIKEKNIFDRSCFFETNEENYYNSTGFYYGHRYD